MGSSVWFIADMLKATTTTEIPTARQLSAHTSGGVTIGSHVEQGYSRHTRREIQLPTHTSGVAEGITPHTSGAAERCTSSGAAERGTHVGCDRARHTPRV